MRDGGAREIAVFVACAVTLSGAWMAVSFARGMVDDAPVHARGEAYEDSALELVYEGGSVRLTLRELGMAVSAVPTETAFSLSGVRVDEGRLDAALRPVAERVAREVRDAAMDAEGNIVPEQEGREMDGDALKTLLWQRVAMRSTEAVPVPVRAVLPRVKATFLEQFGEYAPELSRVLVLTGEIHERKEFSLSEHADMLRVGEGGIVFDEGMLREWVALLGVPFFAKEAGGAVLGLRQGRVDMEGDALPGRKVDEEELVVRMMSALREKRDAVQVPLVEELPRVTVDAELAGRGIREYLGGGETDYTGSAAARTKNVSRAAEILDGTILMPGEEFSFVRALGAITPERGFAKGMVIQGDRLVPEYGGGVCQVSTTLFRGALDAGLPIVEQKAHSMKIAYYYPPGLDATMYPGVVDFRFQNDMATPVAIAARVVGNGQRLRVYFFGTRDGRSAEVVGPYLPSGHLATRLSEVGMRMYWVRKLVLAGGEVREERYTANYKPLPE